MPDASIKAYFGGDTSGLRSAIGEANRSVDQFTKGVKRAGVDLGRGFGFGVLIYQAKQFFDEVINNAQKTRDAFEEMGKAVPSSVASVARLGDEIDRLKKGALELGTAFLGFITKAGEGWGMLINRIRGVSREQEKINEQTERDAERAEKNRDEAYKKAAQTRASNAEKAKRDAEKAAKDREKQLDDEFDNLVKVGDAEKKLASKRKDYAYDQLSLQDKIKAGEKESAELSQKIAEYKQHQNLTTNDQLRVIDLENDLLEVNKNLAEARKELAEKTKLTEEQIIAALVKQKNEHISIAGIRGGNQFNEASDESLAEIVRRNRNEATLMRQGKGGYGIGQNLEIARLETEAANAEKELRFRRDFLRTVSQPGGVEAARRAFKGDPLQFDRVLQNLTTKQEKSTTLLQSLDDRLAAAGFTRN